MEVFSLVVAVVIEINLRLWVSRFPCNSTIDDMYYRTCLPALGCDAPPSSTRHDRRLLNRPHDRLDPVEELADSFVLRV
jgi:hypothetical protein